MEYLDMMEGNAVPQDDSAGAGGMGGGDVSEEEDESEEEEEDLFDEGGESDDSEVKQRRKAAKARRDKRRKVKSTKRADRLKQKQEHRKNALRRAYEPIVLVEHFCTPMDDEIRSRDVPERYQFIQRRNPDFFRPKRAVGEELDDDEVALLEEESMWIMARVPAIAAEFFAAPQVKEGDDATEMDTTTTEGENKDGLKKHQVAVLKSIQHALTYIREDKFEVEFIRHYRADYVTSTTVRDNLYVVMDQHVEFMNMTSSRSKTDKLLDKYGRSSIVKMEKKAELEGGNGNGDGASSSSGRYTEADLAEAKSKLEEALQTEESASVAFKTFEEENPDWETAAVKKEEKIKTEGDEDVDDDLFGGDDDDDDDDNEEAKLKAERKQQGINLRTKVSMSAERVQLYGERVAQIETFLASNPPEEPTVNTNGSDSSIDYKAAKKVCSTKLWDELEYRQYLSTLTEERNVQDVQEYLQLLQEGNEAIRKKSKMARNGDSNAEDEGVEEGVQRKRRSKRFDRDYYRTCVSEGMRSVAYQFLLSPLRAGVKLEENLTSPDGFTFQRKLASERSENDDDDMTISDPKLWVAPRVDYDPDTFASDLVSSGELVLLTQQQGRSHAGFGESKASGGDPLTGCRYVAAMELAYEPRTRRRLRDLYRRLAVISTRPTGKGLSTIDAFHEHYGLHLLKDKPVREHFSDEKRHRASDQSYAMLTPNERKEMDEELTRVEKESCLQYLRLVKAERSGFVSVKVHLPSVKKFDVDDSDWFKADGKTGGPGANADLSSFMEVLEPVYLPTSDEGGADAGASKAWEEERRNVIRYALVQILFPMFEAEARRDLAEAAVKFGVEETADHLRQMAMEGPYRPTHLLGENRFLVPTDQLPIVGACIASADSNREASYLVAMSPEGEVVNSIAIPGGTRLRSNEEMKEKLVDFFVATRPSAVLVGVGGGLNSRQTARTLGDMLSQATERWNNRLIQGEDEDDDDFQYRTKYFRDKYSFNDDDDDDEAWKCNVDLVDDNVAQLFGRSVRSKKEFPDKNDVNLKCAIAIARHGQNPLAELCYAWAVASDTGTFGAEMLYLNVHPMQQHLPKNMLLKAYERVLCEAVAKVGVDVNASCKLDHLHGLLQFIPGLGPRKAASLKQNVQRIGGVVASRRALLQKRLVGPVIYNNSVAFLRIIETDQLSGRHVHPLDDTRLHPDVYHRNTWAVKIAVDALEASASTGGDDDEYAIAALRNVMSDSQKQVELLFYETKKQWEKMYGPTFNVAGWDPREVNAEHWQDKVEELDLETFADMIEESGLGKWLSHLTMIKWEFRLPFEDPRKPMEHLSGDRLFRLLTGESDWSLYPGREVTARIVRNTDFGSRARLEGNINGFIPLRNLSDDHVQTAADVVQEGSVVSAVVTEVKKDHMCVDMSLRMEDFRKPSSAWDRPKSLPPLDPCFDRGAASRIETEKTRERDEHIARLRRQQPARRDEGDKAGSAAGPQPRGRSRVTRRACAHPAFRNSKNDEVDKELRKAGEAMVGEALIRPSSQSTDSLAIHWVVRPGCIKVIEVLEEDKDTDASIGNILRIKDETYGSIDELLGRFIAPMNDKVEEATSYRKWIDKSEDDVDERIRLEKKAAPKSNPYYLCWMETHPGYVSLRFMMSTTVRNHPIGIQPEGFRWGPRVYPSLDLLINDFKKNPRGPGSGRSTPASGGAAPGRRSLTSTSTNRAVADTTGLSKQSRWGARNPNSGSSVSTSTQATSTGTGWSVLQQSAPPAQAATGWGSVSSTAATASTSSGWGHPPPSGRRPPPPVAPQPGFQQPPPTGLPPPPGPPPAHFGQPPPPNLPPPPGPPPAHFGQPPPPPGGPPPPYPPSARGGQVR